MRIAHADSLSRIGANPSRTVSSHEGMFKGDQTMDLVAPLKLMTEHCALSFISTTMIFGTPVDVTSSELAIESFFPADAATAEALRGNVK